MSNASEQIKYQFKKIINKVKKKIVKTILPIVAIVLIVFIVVCGLGYEMTMQDGSYSEGDESNVMYAVREYTDNVTIDSDGTIRTSISAQELWEKMLKNNSRVDEYLSNAAELQKLMNAEIITNYPDTRSADEIDEPLDEEFWNNLNKDVDSTEVQGIIKFKRAQTDGTTSTMTFVDYGTFFNWVEEYNITGDESIKEKLLTHFTIEASTVRSSSSATVTLDYSGENQWTDISEAIVAAAMQSYNEQSSPGKGLCQAWVRQVYAAAGLPDVGYAGAYQAFQETCESTDLDNIPIGAAVYGTGSASYDGGPNIYGHVGIYIGDIDGDGEGEVMDNVGSIQISSLSDWIAWQEAAGNTACGGTPGWLGWGWQSGSPTRFLTDDEIEEAEERLETSASTVVVDSSGTESSGTTSYYVIVAQYSETTEKVTTNDPDVEEYEIVTKTISTQKIDYQSMVSGYQLPFDYLWEWIVAGRDKDFGLDVADLVYGSTLEITIHDNETTVTDEDTYEYTKYTKYETHDIYITGTGTTNTTTTEGTTTTVSINEGPYEGTEEKSPNYTTTYTTITVTNTLNASVTTADVWIVDYSQEFTFEEDEPSVTTSGPTDMEENKEYPSTPDDSDNSDPAGIGAGYKQEVDSKYVTANTTMTCVTDYYYAFNGQVTNKNTVERKKYMGEPKVVKGKDDPLADEDNFVTILLEKEHYNTLNNVKSAPDWLFEMMETSEKTADMVDLTKYLLYKATGRSYGVTDYDFSVFGTGSFSSVSVSITGSDIKEKVWNALKDLGYSDIAVAGAMGNIDYESGGFSASAIEGGSGEGIGLCQWSYGRRTQLETYAASKGVSWTDEDTQIEFLIAEISGQGPAAGYATRRTYGYIINEKITSSHDDWASATTIEDATLYFMRFFESPQSRSSLSERQSRAQRIL